MTRNRSIRGLFGHHDDPPSDDYRYTKEQLYAGLHDILNGPRGSETLASAMAANLHVFQPHDGMTEAQVSKFLRDSFSGHENQFLANELLDAGSMLPNEADEIITLMTSRKNVGASALPPIDAEGLKILEETEALLPEENERAVKTLMEGYADKAPQSIETLVSRSLSIIERQMCVDAAARADHAQTLLNTLEPYGYSDPDHGASAPSTPEGSS